jgi:hypothetical protein
MNYCPVYVHNISNIYPVLHENRLICVKFLRLAFELRADVEGTMLDGRLWYPYP